MKFERRMCNSIVVCWIIWKVINKAGRIYYISSTISSWHVFVSIWEEFGHEFSKCNLSWKNFSWTKRYFTEASYSVTTKNELAALPFILSLFPCNQATIFKQRKYVFYETLRSLTFILPNKSLRVFNIFVSNVFNVKTYFYEVQLLLYNIVYRIQKLLVEPFSMSQFDFKRFSVLRWLEWSKSKKERKKKQKKRKKRYGNFALTKQLLRHIALK